MDAELYHEINKVIPENYDADLIAKGGEHLVFKFDDKNHANIVYKVNYAKSIPLLRSYFLGTKQFDQAVNRLKEDAKSFNEKYRAMRNFFGPESVPLQRVFVNELPITKAIADNLQSALHIKESEMPKTMPAWASVQEKVDLARHKTVDLTAYYPERMLIGGNPFDEQTAKAHLTYDLGYDIFATNDSGWRDGQAMLRTAFDLYGNMKEIYTFVETDENFRQAARKAVKKMIEYTMETGNVMDLAGQNNAVMSKGNSGWKLVLPDVLHSMDIKTELLSDVAEKIAHGQYVDRMRLNHALSALNTVRILNCLATVTGIDERVDLPALRKSTSDHWRSACGLPKARTTQGKAA